MLQSAVIYRDKTFIGIYEALGQGGEAKEIEKGIYISPTFSLGNDILNNKNEYPNFDYELGSYGVCDSVEQVKEKYLNWLNSKDKNYCISFTKVKKSEQSSWGGWRWHKWGEYIGDKEITCEYLYDEPIIEEVYCYHIYELLD